MTTTTDACIRSLSLGFALGALTTAATVHAQLDTRYLYVDASAPPGGNGTSWLRAFRDLQDALSLAYSSSGSIPPLQHLEIRVAQGVYRPDRGTGDRNASFVVTGSATTLVGGFAGLAGADPNTQQNDFVSVLSGDLHGDDGPNFTNRDDNSYHVLHFENSSLNYTFVRQFTIRGGNTGGPIPAAYPDGGGVLVDSNMYSATLASCRITDNEAIGSGGGIACQPGYSVNLVGCTIDNNLARTGQGGGLFASCQTSVILCDFVHNRTDSASGTGGGASLLGSTIIDARFTDNISAGSGGGLALHSACTLTGCFIAGNQSWGGSGGGINDASGGASTFRFCFIGHNFASVAGGGMASSGTSPSLVNCSFVRNTSPGRGQDLSLDSGATADLTNCIVWGETPGLAPFWVQSSMMNVRRSVVQSSQVIGGGSVLWSADTLSTDPRFVNPVGTSSDPLAWQDKDYSLLPSSPCIDAGLDAIPYSMLPIADAVRHTAPVNSTCTAYTLLDIGSHEFQGSICPPPIPVVYVNAAAPAGGNGLSWAGAHRDLRSALRTPGVTEIWIAAGAYTPDGMTHDREAVWHIERPVIELHGGFAGTETSRDQRDIAANPTILSGDLLGNDTADPTTRIDNSRMLIDASFHNNGWGTIVLSGLILQGAESVARYWWLPTGALHVRGDLYMSDCIVRNNRTAANESSVSEYDNVGCVNIHDGIADVARSRFENNSSVVAGAALHVDGAPYIALADCVFSDNRSDRSGGALWLNASNITISDSTFLNNSVVNASSYASGGAGCLLGFSTIDRCRFIGNRAVAGHSSYFTPTGLGGALYCYSPAVLQNSLFASCRAEGSQGAGGAAVYAADGLAAVNCTFADNAGSGAAGTTPASLSFATAPGYFTHVANCIFWNTITPPPAPTTMIDAPNTPLSMFVNSSIVQNASANTAASILNTDPRFVNPAGPDGLLGTTDDNYRLSPTSPAIDRAYADALPAGTLIDLAGRSRFIDDPAHPNLGTGSTTYLDLGCYEFDPRRCPADFNASGALTPQDIFDFLNAWFAGLSAADFNRSGSLTTQDIFDFLNAWFTGC
jgi:hypothetical protein